MRKIGAFHIIIAIAFAALALLTSSIFLGVPRWGQPASTLRVVDPVRLNVGGVIYKIPASFQPYLSDIAKRTDISVRRVLSADGKQYIYEYWQDPNGPPLDVKGFSLPDKELHSFAKANPLFQNLERVTLLVVGKADGVGTNQPKEPRVPMGNGFERHGEGYDTYYWSVAPMLFGEVVRFRRHLLDSHDGYGSYRLNGVREKKNVIMLDAKFPPERYEQWPAILGDVERLLKSMN